MQELEYQVSFTTPAFLGNAEQLAQWRTPPFKALLRHWWRVAYRAANPATDWEHLREAEGFWLGNAWLEHNKKPNYRQSQLRLRLAPWDDGNLDSSKWDERFHMVDVREKQRMRADQYLGYGPILKEGKDLVTRRAIEAGKGQARLQIRCPEDFPHLKETIALVHCFGAVGSRARNAWGSLKLEGPFIVDFHDLQMIARLVRNHAIPLDEGCFMDWPAAFCRDELNVGVWISKPQPEWRQLLTQAAKVRIAVRHAAKRVKGRGDHVGGLYYLGYPAGTGKSNLWSLARSSEEKDQRRFASPLRMKIVAFPAGLRLLVAHLPCMPPDEFFKDCHPERMMWLKERSNYLKTWNSVHATLDDQQALALTRIGEAQ